MRTRKSKARNQRPIRQPRQKVLLLIVRSVSYQQLPRSQRIRHGNGSIGIETLRRQFREDTTNGMRAESQPAPFLWNLHPKEFFIAHVIPGFLGEVFFGDDVVIVEDGAELGTLVVDVGLFFGGEFGGVGVEEVLEGGGAAEDVSIES